MITSYTKNDHFTSSLFHSVGQYFQSSISNSVQKWHCWFVFDFYETASMVPSSQLKLRSNKLEKAEAMGKRWGKVRDLHWKPMALPHWLGWVSGMFLLCPVAHLTLPPGRVKEKSCERWKPGKGCEGSGSFRESSGFLFMARADHSGVVFLLH